MATVVETWDRIHKWLEANAPQVLSTLRPGASEKQLKKLEKKLNLVALPEDFKDCYRIHDGSTADYFFGTSNSSNTFHSIEDIIRDWSVNKEIFDSQGHGEQERQEDSALEIQSTWWLPKWIPFGANGGGDFVQLDLAPTEDGNFGQVMQWYHDGDDPELLASSFTEFLKKFVKELEAGKFLATDDDGLIRLLHKEYKD